MYKHRFDYQPSFWENVTQIEIGPERWEWEFAKDRVTPPVSQSNNRRSTEDKIRLFWESVKTAFPSVKKVSVKGFPPHTGEAGEVAWTTLRAFLDAAPRHVDVMLALSKRAHFSTFVLRDEDEVFVVGSNMWHGWRSYRLADMEIGWTPRKKILAPGVWDLPEGKVKAYERMLFARDTWEVETTGYRNLVLELWVHTYARGGRACLYSGCEYTCEKVGEWYTHHRTGHYRRHLALKEPDVSSDMKALLEHKVTRLNALDAVSKQRWLEMRHAMKEYGSFAAYLAEVAEEVREYLMPDTCPNRELKVREYIGALSSRFNPTHMRYNPVVKEYDGKPVYGVDEEGMGVFGAGGGGSVRAEEERHKAAVKRWDAFWMVKGL
jgi:hypothetical protein